jgi:N-acyl-D-amino-acid deacylase
MTHQKFDILLRHGIVVDGTGQRAFPADVAIRADRIVAIGDLRNAVAARELDVTGLVVAPGFIDVHTHDDSILVERPQMLPKLTQGVTTVIAGNCGISAAPYSRAGAPPDLLHLLFKSDSCTSASFDQYVSRVSDSGPAVNAAFLTGHTTLRLEVMGADDLQRVATTEEVDRMRDLLAASLEQGSLGLSTGLFYPPARAASTNEVIGVAAALVDYGGLYVTHMRDEADGVLDSIEETLRIGREVPAPVVISHHKCMGPRNFGRSIQTLARLDEARTHQSVAWDVYPYTAGSSILHLDLVDASSRTVVTWSDPHPEFAGHDLLDVTRTLNCSVAEAVSRLQPAGAVYFMMDENDVARIVASSAAMIGSDGLPEDSHPHPRLWGTFPRVFKHYVRERCVLSLENAVHRMTGLSARCFGIAQRGELKEGFFADLTVFDQHRIADAATFDSPVRPAEGIEYVFVNGELALEQGIATSSRAGRVLRRGHMPHGSASTAVWK